MQVPPEWLRVLAVLAVLTLPTIFLVGCSEISATLPTPCTNPSGTDTKKDKIEVYFGCGCFWHVQHEFVMLEMTQLCRNNANLTARAAYAGGNNVGEYGLVCYHNAQNKADYGSMGHAEVVSLSLPETSFAEFADKFWEVCPGGARRDPQDAGGEYRSVIGLPGGSKSPLMHALRQKANGVKLVTGNGNEGDTIGLGKVYVYDISTFPAHTAEKYHQFHDDMMESYGAAYNSLRQYATSSDCPGDQAWGILQ